MFEKQHLKDLLHKNVMSVTFLKRDGTVRQMKCTLREDLVVPHEKSTERVKQQNDDVLAVWDIDKKAWRSFRYDSVQGFFPITD